MSAKPGEDHSEQGGAMRVGYRIAMDQQRPTWNEDDFFGEMFGNQ